MSDNTKPTTTEVHILCAGCNTEWGVATIHWGERVKPEHFVRADGHVLTEEDSTVGQCAKCEAKIPFFAQTMRTAQALSMGLTAEDIGGFTIPDKADQN